MKSLLDYCGCSAAAGRELEARKLPRCSSYFAALPIKKSEERAAVMVNKKIRLLRDYQLDAIRALQKAAAPSQPNSTSSPREERAGRGPRRGAANQDAPPLPSPLLHPMEGRERLTQPCSPHRFLFEMATGTGKTLLSAAIAKLYLRTENAHRILFLVDRLELENQAWKNFTAYLANDGISTVIYKQKRQDWKQAQVVVTTIQSLAARNRFLHEFAPTDFQLIISDEAHRANGPAISQPGPTAQVTNRKTKRGPTSRSIQERVIGHCAPSPGHGQNGVTDQHGWAAPLALMGFLFADSLGRCPRLG